MGQKSILHAVEIRSQKLESTNRDISIIKEDFGDKPLNETLKETAFYDDEETAMKHEGGIHIP